MTNEVTYLTSPVGRFIMGDAFTGSDKDQQGRPRLNQQGQPKTQWFMALAFPKNDPEWAALWQQITAIGQRDFPNGEWQRPDFAWKVVDGDAKYPGRPECAGCVILRCSTGFAPTVYDANNAQIVNPAECKRGDYVRVYIGVRGNGDGQKPGVYINHQLVQRVGFGEAILAGASPDEAFAAPANLPPGASATPVAGAPMPAMPAQPPVPGLAAPAPVPAAPPPATSPAGTGAPPPVPTMPHPSVPAPRPVADAHPTMPGQPAPSTMTPHGAPDAAVPGQSAAGAPSPGTPTAYPSNQPAPYPAILGAGQPPVA